MGGESFTAAGVAARRARLLTLPDDGPAPGLLPARAYRTPRHQKPEPEGWAAPVRENVDGVPPAHPVVDLERAARGVHAERAQDPAERRPRHRAATAERRAPARRRRPQHRDDPHEQPPADEPRAERRPLELRQVPDQRGDGRTDDRQAEHGTGRHGSHGTPPTGIWVRSGRRGSASSPGQPQSVPDGDGAGAHAG